MGRKSLQQLIFEAKTRSLINAIKLSYMNEKQDEVVEILEGDKVRINMQSIQERRDKGQQMSQAYLEWLDKNKDKTFTVQYDKGQEYNLFVTLKEDKTKPKWLMWIYDLEKVT